MYWYLNNVLAVYLIHALNLTALFVGIHQSVLLDNYVRMQPNLMLLLMEWNAKA